jgi:hypothetical protein
VVADRRKRERLLSFAADFTPRTRAIEAASGLGALDGWANRDQDIW